MPTSSTVSTLPLSGKNEAKTTFLRVFNSTVAPSSWVTFRITKLRYGWLVIRRLPSEENQPELTAGKAATGLSGTLRSQTFAVSPLPEVTRSRRQSGEKVTTGSSSVNVFSGASGLSTFQSLALFLETVTIRFASGEKFTAVTQSPCRKMVGCIFRADRFHNFAVLSPEPTSSCRLSGENAPATTREVWGKIVSGLSGTRTSQSFAVSFAELTNTFAPSGEKMAEVI